jgi:hypothetical protein
LFISIRHFNINLSFNNSIASHLHYLHHHSQWMRIFHDLIQLYVLLIHPNHIKSSQIQSNHIKTILCEIHDFIPIYSHLMMIWWWRWYNERVIGVGVWFSLWVQEVSHSIPESLLPFTISNISCFRLIWNWWWRFWEIHLWHIERKNFQFTTRVWNFST